MTDSMHNPLGTRTTLDTPDGTAHAYALESLEKAGLGSISRMPYSIKVLLEAVVRNCDGETVTEDDIKTLAGWPDMSAEKKAQLTRGNPLTLRREKRR